MEYKGRLVYFGCGLAQRTFLHYLETVTNLPYLKDSVCRVKNKDGLRTVYIPKTCPETGISTVMSMAIANFSKALASGLK